MANTGRNNIALSLQAEMAAMGGAVFCQVIFDGIVSDWSSFNQSTLHDNPVPQIQRGDVQVKTGSGFRYRKRLRIES